MSLFAGCCVENTAIAPVRQLGQNPIGTAVYSSRRIWAIPEDPLEIGWAPGLPVFLRPPCIFPDGAVGALFRPVSRLFLVA